MLPDQPRHQSSRLVLVAAPLNMLTIMKPIWLLAWLSFSSCSTAQMQEVISEETLCSTSRIQYPKIDGLHFLDLVTTSVKNHTFPAFPGFTKDVLDTNFCNVTLTYTHPGWGDNIRVVVYLPTEGWNGRFQANGGGGFVTGGESLVSFTMAPALRDGYSVATTDGGHSDAVVTNVSEWALSSPGNVNWHLFLDFASVALHDMATIGKAVTAAYYGTPAKYSYFHGLSTGGRQGIMLAQKYPKDFDGIIAICPATNWPQFLLADYYPQFIMNRAGEYPRPCELSAMTDAAIAVCDGLDGVLDGIISLPGICHFDPHELVGQLFDCQGVPSTFSKTAADVADAAWTGPRSSSGRFQWYGIGKDSDLGSKGNGIATTACDEDGTCKGVPFTIPADWITFWLMKDPSFDPSTITTHDQWDSLFHASVDQYQSAIGSASPDLSEFRKAGGKMLSWHGLRDEVIPVNGSTHYFDRVLEVDPMAQEYFRLFLVPGTGHNSNGGLAPHDLNDVIIQWVEEGIAPNTLRATGVDGHGKAAERDVCLYPRIQVYQSGDPTLPSSFACVEA